MGSNAERVTVAPKVQIKPGQTWRRKKDGSLVVVKKMRSELVFDDWRIQREGARNSQLILGYNLRALYELVQDVD